MSQTVYADVKRGAKGNNILPDDQVLHKNTKAIGEFTPNFESEPYTAKVKKGNK